MTKTALCSTGNGFRTWLVLKSVLVLYVLFLVSCSSDKANSASPEAKKALIASIDSLQRNMFNRQNMEMDKSLVSKAIVAYQDFVKNFPEDSLSAEYLFRLSDLSRATGDNKKAIEYLDQICKTYPAFRKIPECLFLQGYYYQEYFNDTVQAKAFYTNLLEKYPTHAFSDDAKALMKMFGKSEQDIIKEFEKKEAEKKSS